MSLAVPGAGTPPRGLRVRLIAADPVRRRGLAAVLAEAGHAVAGDGPDAELPGVAGSAIGSPDVGPPDVGPPDVVLFDRDPREASADMPPPETGAPVVMLTDRRPAAPPAGVLPRRASAEWIDLALRAAAAGLRVQAPWPRPRRGFGAAEDESPLTPRETEILTLVGQGLGNKAVARRLGISVRTVKFHLEGLFDRLGAANRAEAVAKGLMGGVIEL